MNGKHKSISNNKQGYPEQLLSAKLMLMNKEEVHSLLCHLLTLEYGAHPAHTINNFGAYYLRLKWKRIKTVRHYVTLGGKVSPLALKRSLPKGKHWPGVVNLVETRIYRPVKEGLYKVEIMAP
ncbi:MAG: hypothetical protein ACI8WB_005597 [Phenylobacterium sp.]|jgi:hypothetical protein